MIRLTSSGVKFYLYAQHKGSSRHTWRGHQFQGQKVKGQLVADVLNSQHASIGATWRINAKIIIIIIINNVLI